MNSEESEPTHRRLARRILPEQGVDQVGRLLQEGLDPNGALASYAERLGFVDPQATVEAARKEASETDPAAPLKLVKAVLRERSDGHNPNTIG